MQATSPQISWSCCDEPVPDDVYFEVGGFRSHCRTTCMMSAMEANRNHKQCADYDEKSWWLVGMMIVGMIGAVALAFCL